MSIGDKALPYPLRPGVLRAARANLQEHRDKA
jgi:hypothetical protein